MCLKNHSCNLHAPLCGIFYLHSVDIARYAALIQTKSPINCDIYLAESIFQTHSSEQSLFLCLYPNQNRPAKIPYQAFSSVDMAYLLLPFFL
ncbi:DUF6783 domain-containing protein [[Ruminococcus] lactaris]|uniref:DUF6783 domain-containing protein n=1 Tax=[Ruminococcus] lactaris TaxID=46228 RepID=UPI0011C7685B|nr:DUF6783 domain-containing protein [[Ruminococcus] lactaris]